MFKSYFLINMNRLIIIFATDRLIQINIRLKNRLLNAVLVEVSSVIDTLAVLLFIQFQWVLIGLLVLHIDVYDATYQ